MDPFLPWPGSKTKCAAEIISEFPAEFGTYYEPFLGSGAIFFAMADGETKRELKRAELSDINRKLIQCWLGVYMDPKGVSERLAHCLERNSEEFYYLMRDQMSNPAAFIYCMRAGFSSLYRENRKGGFNVPWRKSDFEKGRAIGYDVTRIEACSKYLDAMPVSLCVREWSEAVRDVKAGDLVYFDPPYVPFSKDGFVDYSKESFGKGEHVFLRASCAALSRRGAHVFMSNSYTEETVRLYGEPSKVLNITNAVKANAKVKGIRTEGLWIWRPN